MTIVPNRVLSSFICVNSSKSKILVKGLFVGLLAVSVFLLSESWHERLRSSLSFDFALTWCNLLLLLLLHRVFSLSAPYLTLVRRQSCCVLGVTADGARDIACAWASRGARRVDR